MVGFGAYSEGLSADFNMMMWSLAAADALPDEAVSYEQRAELRACACVCLTVCQYDYTSVRCVLSTLRAREQCSLHRNPSLRHTRPISSRPET